MAENEGPVDPRVALREAAQRVRAAKADAGAAPEPETAPSARATALGERAAAAPGDADPDPAAEQEPQAADPAATALGERAAARAAAPVAVPANATGRGERGTPDSANSRPTALGRKPVPAADDSVLRFGSGPGDEPVVATAAPEKSKRPPRRRRGRAASFGAGFVSGLVVAGVIVFLLSRVAPAMRVTGAAVAPANNVQSTCDVVVDVVGTVTTNGQRGSISYQWLRSDGEQSQVLTQSVPEGTTTATVHLLWTLSGKGTYPATATLRILDPDPIEVTGKFTYSCQ